MELKNGNIQITKKTEFTVQHQNNGWGKKGKTKQSDSEVKFCR